MLFKSFYITRDDGLYIHDSRMRNGHYPQIRIPHLRSNNLFFCLIDPKVYDIKHTFRPYINGKTPEEPVSVDPNHVIEIMWHYQPHPKFYCDNPYFCSGITVYIRIGERDGKNSLYYHYDSIYGLNQDMFNGGGRKESNETTFDDTFAKVLVCGSNSRRDIYGYFDRVIYQFLFDKYDSSLICLNTKHMLSNNGLGKLLLTNSERFHFTTFPIYSSFNKMTVVWRVFSFNSEKFVCVCLKVPKKYNPTQYYVQVGNVTDVFQSDKFIKFDEKLTPFYHSLKKTTEKNLEDFYSELVTLSFRKVEEIISTISKLGNQSDDLRRMFDQAKILLRSCDVLSLRDKVISLLLAEFQRVISDPKNINKYNSQICNIIRMGKVVDKIN